MLIAKVTDDILMAGPVTCMEKFVPAMANRFEIREVIIGRPFMFNGCEIARGAERGKKIDITRYMSKIEPVEIDGSCKADKLGKASQDGISRYRKRAG